MKVRRFLVVCGRQNANSDELGLDEKTGVSKSQIIKLITEKKVSLSYPCMGKDGTYRNNIQLYFSADCIGKNPFSLIKNGYAVFQKGVIDEAYQNADDALLKFYKLIDVWEKSIK